MTHAGESETSDTTNRLASSKSPYLLQHAGNPVDWYPWSSEAFERAERENKPIFLSIGYATCHWCHVMEHESFEDADVAALMNEVFVNIKVDREERPDIDQVYMAVCQMMTGSGGWPLTIVMTPEKIPFFAGTYIPRKSVYGRIGMLDLIPKIAEVWQSDRDKVSATTRQITAALNRLEARPSASTLEPSTVEIAFQQLGGRYDALYGGFGTAPKFPSPHNLVFLTRYWHETGNRLAVDMVERTLERMRYGGIFDHVGFGFHRYSTDTEWLVPHFEKMLYDQAMMVLALTEAWQATGAQLFERTVREVVTYVLRDMTSPEGGFFSAEDADSEGEEGLFYLWTLDETKSVVGPEAAELAASTWNLTAEGNYADEATGERTGRNIPHLTRSLPESAAAFGMELADFESKMEGLRQSLFAVREDRVHPLKDDKVLADWNGLMAAALARAGRVFDEPGWIEAAENSVAFVTDRMRDARGRLLHRYRDGEASIPAFLDDHVFMTSAMIELHEATLDATWLQRAVDLQETTIDLFWDAGHGGFFFAADDNEELLVRKKEVYDGAIPSGNSTAADNLVRLARLTGNRALAETAETLLSAFSAEAKQLPSAHCQLLSALQRASSPSLEVVIAGEPGANDTRSLIDTLKKRYMPHAAVLLVPPGKNGDSIRKMAPFTEAYGPVDGKAAAYVCRDFQCKLPVTDPQKLEELLDEASTGRSEST